MGLFPIDTQRECGCKEIKLLWQPFEFVELKTICKAVANCMSQDLWWSAEPMGHRFTRVHW